MDNKKLVRDFIVSESESIDNHEDLNDDISLIEVGVIDSLLILTLISFLDEKFGIMPSEDEIYPENFETVNMICDYIDKKLNGNQL